MNTKFYFYGFLLPFFVLEHFFLFSQENWELIKNVDGIKISTKNTKNIDFKSFKANMVLDNNIHAFIAVLTDVEGLINWGYKIKNASLLKKSGDTLQIYYAEAKAPFPYKNRDGIYRNRFTWISDTNTLSVDIEILDDYLELKDQFVRIKGNGFWEVKVLPSGKLDVTFVMLVDPGGSIPAWLANIFVDDSPYYTMQKLREVIKIEKYKNQKYNFIH